MGTCEYCGQVLAGAETDEEATAECLCFEATARRKRVNAAKEAKRSYTICSVRGRRRAGLSRLPMARSLRCARWWT